jgi:hypothetical protein
MTDLPTSLPCSTATLRQPHPPHDWEPQPGMNPVHCPGHDQTETTEATEAEKTTRVFAALHRSAEQDVSRVIALYERWVKAGPPPLGASIARWWDARLVELHNAIRPPADQTKEQ